MFFKWLSKIFIKSKKIDVSNLPSQGYFYDSDFKIKIKAADDAEVADYEANYDKENVSVVLTKLKSIVESNVILEKGYTFDHIKSIDIVYLFLEIVKFTKKKSIYISYFDDKTGNIDQVSFDKENFNYFNPDEWLHERWNSEKKCFVINGYCTSLPSIGIENSLTHYLIEKSYESGAERFNDYSYNFTFFLDNRARLSFEEIDNLIEIFNSDLDDDEKSKVDDAVYAIKPMQRYSLRKNGRVIEMSSKINLENIWK